MHLHPADDTRREVIRPVLHLLTGASPPLDDGRSIAAAGHVEHVMTGLGLPVNEAWAAIAIARAHVAAGGRTALRHVDDASAAGRRRASAAGTPRCGEWRSR